VQNVISGGGASASPTFGNVGNADQRSKIGTINISPTYTRVIGNNSVFNLGAFVRKDDYHYYPSANPLADLGPANLQTSSIAQYRTLTNAAVHSDYSYAKESTTSRPAPIRADLSARKRQPGRRRSDVPTTRPAWTRTATPLPVTPVRRNATAQFRESELPPVLAPYDLTRGGSLYIYFGHADVKELALYIEDQIKAGNWLFNLGLRGDSTTA
jgi:hypothetical protein